MLGNQGWDFVAVSLPRAESNRPCGNRRSEAATARAGKRIDTVATALHAVRERTPRPSEAATAQRNYPPDAGRITVTELLPGRSPSVHVRLGHIRESRMSSDAFPGHFSLENRPNSQRAAKDDRPEIYASKLTNDRA